MERILAPEPRGSLRSRRFPMSLMNMDRRPVATKLEQQEADAHPRNQTLSGVTISKGTVRCRTVLLPFCPIASIIVCTSWLEVCSRG